MKGQIEGEWMEVHASDNINIIGIPIVGPNLREYFLHLHMKINSYSTPIELYETKKIFFS